MITRRLFDLSGAASDDGFIPNRSGVEVDAIAPRFSVNGLKDQRVAAHGLAGAQPIPELRRSGRSPNTFAEMLKWQRYAIAGAKSQLIRIAVDLFIAGGEDGHGQIDAPGLPALPAHRYLGGNGPHGHP